LHNIRTKISSSTGFSPYNLAYGVSSPTTLDWKTDVEIPDTPGVKEYLNKLLPTLILARESAENNIAEMERRYKQAYDRKWRTKEVVPFTPGTLCYKENTQFSTNKMEATFTGPYEVVAPVHSKDGCLVYKVRNPRTGRTYDAVNHHFLKRYHEIRDGDFDVTIFPIGSRFRSSEKLEEDDEQKVFAPEEVSNGTSDTEKVSDETPDAVEAENPLPSVVKAEEKIEEEVEDEEEEDADDTDTEEESEEEYKQKRENMLEVTRMRQAGDRREFLIHFRNGSSEWREEDAVPNALKESYHYKYTARGVPRRKVTLHK